MNIRLLVLVILMCAGPLGGLTSAEPPRSGEAKLKVFVSILPLQYFVQRVGGDHVQVNVMVGEGQDVHTYEPTPRSMTELAKARVFFQAGRATRGTATTATASERKIPTFGLIQSS